MTEKRIGGNDKEIIQAQIEQDEKERWAKMSNWQETVIKYQEKHHVVAGSSEWHMIDGYNLGAKAQAKHTGELAEAVIVWMCYFAQRQERERIFETLEWLLPFKDFQIGGKLYREWQAAKKFIIERGQALRGDKGE